MRRPTLSLLFAVALIGPAVAGDESKPWSQIETGTIRQSDPDLHKVRVMAIDGRWTLTPEPLYQVEPGRRTFVLATTKAGFRGEATYVEFGIEMQPCVSYQFVAEHVRGANNREWRPTIVAAKPIKRCMKKFGIDAAETAPPPLAPVSVPAT